MGIEPVRVERSAASAAAHVLPSLILVFLVAGLGLAARMRPDGAGAPAAPRWIDPAEARVVAVPSWVDPRWLGQLGAFLAQQEPFAAGAVEPVESLRAGLAALSFVERVEGCRSSSGGLELALVLRQPVACIRTRGEYALVDRHGVVLAGRWSLPPRLGRAPLPVIGPLDDPLLDGAREGDWLSEPEHADALGVALSLAEHLDAERRAGLGRVVIDARAARRTSVEEPGVRLVLEGARVALFGRAPGADEPGELSPAEKWRSLARALELFEGDPLAFDWELVDLRWDRPDLALRGTAQVAARDPGAELAQARARRERAPREGRPRVR
jgi:hypothetical protein